jgi:hypothetical protein
LSLFIIYYFTCFILTPVEWCLMNAPKLSPEKVGRLWCHPAAAAYLYQHFTFIQVQARRNLFLSISLNLRKDFDTVNSTTAPPTVMSAPRYSKPAMNNFLYTKWLWWNAVCLENTINCIVLGRSGFKLVLLHRHICM